MGIFDRGIYSEDGDISSFQSGHIGLLNYRLFWSRENLLVLKAAVAIQTLAHNKFLEERSARSHKPERSQKPSKCCSQSEDDFGGSHYYIYEATLGDSGSPSWPAKSGLSSHD